MYKIKRFSFNQRKQWMIRNDMTNLPNGAIPHLRKSYSNYNAVWKNPDKNEYIKSSKISKYSSKYKEDIKDLTKSQTDRLNICLNQLNSGKFIFDDDDKSISENINNKNSLTYFNWDTCTHWLQNESTDDYLVYSKDISGGRRLTYKVYKPVKINGIWTCNIEISRCGEHKYENKSYGKRRNTIENSGIFVGDSKKYFSNLKQ
jgi:hypothetical protein